MLTVIGFAAGYAACYFGHSRLVDFVAKQWAKINSKAG